MFALWLITLCLGTTDQAPATTVALAVVAPPGVTDSLVKRICAEAQEIWGRAGIALDWQRQASKDAANGLTIEVTIDDRQRPVGREGALGWILFTNEGADPSIHLSRASAEALLRSTPDIVDSTRMSHEALIGRALGRALAHELGHYIFQSKSHTPRGLMRADWTSDEAFALNRGEFELTSQERATAADRLWMDLACHARVQEASSC